jgi:hypothetical protein
LTARNRHHIEDAVDVADSYASIYNKDIRKLILGEVQTNLDESNRKKNRRATDL